MQLESFVAGGWQAGAGAGSALRDATTGSVIAHATAEGLDMGAVLEHARRVGGPNLRRLTFHERAAQLKALAKLLTEHKDEFYTLSYATGATKGDSWIDIDGGIGTLFVYASKGTRELPNSRVYVDGGVEALSKGGTFVGAAHLRAARRRGGAHQRLQLPGVGHAREAGPDAARRRAGDRQARHPDQLPHRAGVPPHHRVRPAARRRGAADLRRGR